MTRDEFKNAIIGKSIADISMRDRDTFGNSVEDNELLICSITLNDGMVIYLTGSTQIECDEVCVELKLSQGN